MCDLLCALPAATGGPTLFAKNSDRPPHEVQVFEWWAPRVDQRVTPTTHVEVVAHPSATYGVLGARPMWGWGMEQGVNDQGLAAGNATIYTTLDPRPFPDALTGMDLVRLVLERCATAAAGADLLEHLLTTVGQGGSGHDGARRPYWSSFLLADPDEAYVVETSGATCAVDPVSGVRATSNRTTIPEFTAAHAHPRQPVDTLVRPRLDASERVLARHPVTLDALMSHLRSHEGGADGWTVCMHVDGPGHREATTASMVVELASAAAAPVAHVLVGSPCQGTYERIDLADLAGTPDRVIGR